MLVAIKKNHVRHAAWEDDYRVVYSSKKSVSDDEVKSLIARKYNRHQVQRCSYRISGNNVAIRYTIEAY